MSKSNLILFISALVLPIIPLLFLYNQNFQYLYFPHIIFSGFVLIIISAIYYLVICNIYKSNFYAFLASIILVFFLFAHNNIYEAVASYGYSSVTLLLLIPFVTYVIIFVLNKTFGPVKYEIYPILILVFIIVMLFINTKALLFNSITAELENDKYMYKTDYKVEQQLPSPNVYWILCDGMLGFDVIEKYFNDSQEELTNNLIDRGFKINRSAMLESGHSTSAAIPILMCPDYYDNYMGTYKDHELAVKMNFFAYTKLYSARYNNEIVKAFCSKGYTTSIISLDDKLFFPIADNNYYIDISYQSPKYYKLPNLVKRNAIKESINVERIYANNLGNVFLGGIPSSIYDKIYNYNDIVKESISTPHSKTSEVLLNSSYSFINTALINSIYDAVNSKEIDNPKFVIVHNLIAHEPYCFDEYGNFVGDMHDTNSYYNHHKYASKVLINIVDMILEKDSNAVIVLQSDHGLHLGKEQIIEELKDPNSPIFIWNNVFSAVRIPDDFINYTELNYLKDPRNITRYLVNNFVGENYNYLNQ